MFDALKTGAMDTMDELGILSPVATEKKTEQTRNELDVVYALSPVVAEIHSRYQRAFDARTPVVENWLSNMLQWRGIFSPEEAAQIARAKERNVYASSVFIKLTKTKVTSVLGQIIDIVFDNDTIPIHLESTPVPDGAADVAFIAPQEYPDMDPYGYAGDGKELEPGSTTKSVLGQAYEKFTKFLENKKLIKGASPDGAAMPIVTPAQDAANKMQKTILDQMEEGHLKREIRSATWECVVLGTGILKGPMNYKQVNHKWEREDDGSGNMVNKYAPEVVEVPRSHYVSCWNFYPDPSATCVDDMEWCIEKHLMSRSELSGLKRYTEFDTLAIDRLLIHGAKARSSDYWEQQIRDVTETFIDDRFEVMEYWGYLERGMLEAFQAAVGKDLDLLEGTDQFQVNAWICQGEILRLIINPFVPQRLPYYIVPYEEHTQQIWGIAIPENMRDSQILMNGHYRMMVDNLALAGNVIFEVNENYLAPGQDLTMYPGKVIRTNNGAPGQSIFSIGFKDTSQSHMMAFDKARQIADEVTGLPSYAHGGATTTGATRTAAGMSMLMGAAAGNIRQVVKQFDEYVFRPMGEAYFHWNMQFNDDAEIKGDVSVIAGGTAALMKREVMSQRLLQFAQAVGANPAIAPRVNWDMWLKEFAKSINLDSDKFINDATMSLLAADIMGRASGQGPQQGQQPGAQGQGSNPNDQTGGGGGTIAPGTPTMPGEQQFSGGGQDVQ